MALLSLIADLEPSFNHDIDFLMFPRFDTKTRDARSIEKLNEKFTVIHGRSKRQSQGWPVGPNAQAMDAFKWCHSRYTSGEFDYCGAFLIEADGLPLRRSWLNEIRGEWLLAQSKGAMAMGHWDGHGKELEKGSHMNGNMVFHPVLINEIMELAYGDVPEGGWDMRFWPAIKPFAYPSSLIFSDYRLNTPKNPLMGCCHLFEPRRHNHPHNPLFGSEIYPCYLHGVKGLTGIQCVRDKILVET